MQKNRRKLKREGKGELSIGYYVYSVSRFQSTSRNSFFYIMPIAAAYALIATKYFGIPDIRGSVVRFMQGFIYL